ncbi:MAG: ferredoxin [Actinomycetota bacterium]
MTVSVDADLCSGCGCCVALCGSVFTHLDPEGHDVGVSHVQQHGSVLPPGAAADVPPEYEAVAILAAEECPGRDHHDRVHRQFDGSAKSNRITRRLSRYAKFGGLPGRGGDSQIAQPLAGQADPSRRWRAVLAMAS